MSTIRKHGEKWQSLVCISGHPQLSKSFASKADARQWALSTELKIRREDAGVLKIKYPYFKDIALCYINEVSTTKRSYKKERYLINIKQLSFIFVECLISINCHSKSLRLKYLKNLFTFLGILSISSII